MLNAGDRRYDQHGDDMADPFHLENPRPDQVFSRNRTKTGLGTIVG